MFREALARPSDGPEALLGPLSALTLALVPVFILLPAIDLAAAALFHVPGAGFPMAEDVVALAIRDAFRLAFDASVALAAALLVLALALHGRGGRFPLRVAVFFAAAQAIGPGLIVNALLKDQWGRARPDHVTDFGGEAAFSPAWILSDACARNCSFVSGEAAAAATLALVAALLAAPALAPALRRPVLAALLLAGVVPGVLRLGMGRHFLSDVVFALLISAVVTLALYRLLDVGAARRRVTAGALTADLRLAGALLRGLAAPPPPAPLAPPDLRPRPPVEGGLSLVVPMRDEADSAEHVLAEIADAAAALGPFELVVVDDGSADATAAQLAALAPRHGFLRLVRHARPAGQSAAIHSGVAAARGALVVTLDGDGQNPPREIVRLIDRLDRGRMPAGVGMIAGQRVGRRDGAWKRLGSCVGNGVRGALLRDGVRDTGCGLKLFRRDAYLALPYFDHMHRFLPALFVRDGWRVELVDVAHAPRRAGRSKYGNLGRAAAGALDLFGVAWLVLRRKRAVPTETELRP